MKKTQTWGPTIILSLSIMFTTTGCASRAVEYQVAAPQAIESEAQKQEQMVQNGMSSNFDQSPASPTTRLEPVERLAAVAERVLISAAPFCGKDVIRSYPISIGTPDNGPAVVVNAIGDLHPGDRILALDGRPAPSGHQAFKTLNFYGGDKAQKNLPLQITAQRGQRVFQTTYQPIPSCGYDVVLEDSQTWNAYADGSAIHVELDLMNDVVNDDELAFVLAHELSHNILGHVNKSQKNVMIGAAAGLAIEAIAQGFGGIDLGGNVVQAAAGVGGMTYSKEYEREADYMGLYVLATTGYDLQAGPRVARAIARQDPNSIRYASSHPSSAERAAALAMTIQEIENKQRTGQPLMPNLVAKPQ